MARQKKIIEQEAEILEKLMKIDEILERRIAALEGEYSFGKSLIHSTESYSGLGRKIILDALKANHGLTPA
jgi:hypothetical protein